MCLSRVKTECTQTALPLKDPGVHFQGQIVTLLQSKVTFDCDSLVFKLGKCCASLNSQHNTVRPLLS